MKDKLAYKTYLEGFGNFFKMLSSRGSLHARSVFLTKSSAD